MRWLGYLWKGILALAALCSFTALYLVWTHGFAPISPATAPQANAGPGAVDDLLQNLARGVNGIASTVESDPNGTLHRAADKLDSVRESIGGSQAGFDKIGGALDNALGTPRGAALDTTNAGRTGPTRIEGQAGAAQLPDLATDQRPNGAQANARQLDPNASPPDLNGALGADVLNDPKLKELTRQLGLPGDLDAQLRQLDGLNLGSVGGAQRPATRPTNRGQAPAGPAAAPYVPPDPGPPGEVHEVKRPAQPAGGVKKGPQRLE